MNVHKYTDQENSYDILLEYLYDFVYDTHEDAWDDLVDCVRRHYELKPYWHTEIASAAGVAKERIKHLDTTNQKKYTQQRTEILHRSAIAIIEQDGRLI